MRYLIRFLACIVFFGVFAPLQAQMWNGPIEPIKIYPNPARDIIHVEWLPEHNVTSVVVFNAIGGKFVELEGLHEQSIGSLDLTTLQPGVYFLRIFMDGKQYYKTVPIVKEN